MNPNSWAGAAHPHTLLGPQAVTTITNGSGVDVQPYFGSAMALLCSNAGSSDSLTTNGTFAADSGWTKGDGWTISTVLGRAVCSALGTLTDVKQNQACTEDAVYTVTYTVSSYAIGSVTPYLGGTAGTARTANGTYVETITCGAGVDPKLVFRASADFAGNIGVVSVIAAVLNVKLQESSDNSSFTDITGATFAPVYGIASVQTVAIDLDRAKPYVRSVSNPGTAASASFTHSITIAALKP
jgi:hypothetical protein